MDYKTRTHQRGQRSKSRPRSKHARLWLAPLIVLVAGVVSAADGERRPPLPQAGEDRHLGVATCAGSTCHGSAEPLEASPVLQNEYLTWHRRDAHARAYETLRSERSERIAARLGLGPAHEADACLDCHADHIPQERRGPEFQLADGIGCEGCHGGAERWIRTHAAPDATHADNLERGLYPLDRPEDRARLCLSCHYSHPDTPMRHRIMAAGHPPLQFELATFSGIQPPHYRVDADYRERKRAPTAARTWAVGQVTDARAVLARLRDDLYRGGLFPELYYFDCNACHHDIGGSDWVGRPTPGLAPGSVRLEDASLQMLATLLRVIEPALAERWVAGLDRLHAASGEGAAAVRAAADRLHAIAGTAAERLGPGRVAGEAVVELMGRITARMRQNGFGDRTSSDQAAMALASLLTTARAESILSVGRATRLEGALDRVYAALDDPGDYSPWRYRDALRAFERSLP